MPKVSIAGDVGIFAYAARLAFHVRPHAQTLDGAPTGSELRAGAAAGLRLLDKKFTLGPEFYSGTVVTHSNTWFARRTTPVEFIIGGHYQVNGKRGIDKSRLSSFQNLNTSGFARIEDVQLDTAVVAPTFFRLIGVKRLVRAKPTQYRNTRATRAVNA